MSTENVLVMVSADVPKDGQGNIVLGVFHKANFYVNYSVNILCK